MGKAVVNLPAAASYTISASAVPGFGFLEWFTPKVRDILLSIFGPTGELATAVLFDNVTCTTYETHELCGMGS